MAQPAFQAYFGLDGSTHATTITSAIGVSAFVGCTVSTLFLPLGADSHGRKFNFWVYGTLLVLGGAIQAGSINSSMLIASRVIVGMAAGVLFSSVPIYQSEVAPAHLRGALIACHGVLFCMGSTLSQWLNLAFFFTDGDVSWRTPLAIQCVFPLCLLACLRFVPESPRFLVGQGKHEEALQILERLHAGPQGALKDLVQDEYQAILDAEAFSTNTATWSDLVATPANRKRTFLACFVGFFYAFTGVNVIAGYAGTILADLGLDAVQVLVVIASLITSKCVSG